MTSTKEIILITGAAGFIGYHLIKKLLENEFEIIGLDNINDYYMIELKFERLKLLGFDISDIKTDQLIDSKAFPNLKFIKADISNNEVLNELFMKYQFKTIVNLAGQAGVRSSYLNPDKFFNANIIGFFNIIENCKKFNSSHLIYASSSSIYGNSHNLPFRVGDGDSEPLSVYAATKKTNELLAYSYSNNYGIATTGLRFFSVYGPLGRPDMAYFDFTKKIINDEPIVLFNNGKMSRDMTYIDDIIQAIFYIINSPSQFKNDSDTKYKVYNIGNNQPVNLLDFVQQIEDILQKKAKIEYGPKLKLEVETTYSDNTDLIKDYNFSPNTSVKIGLEKFIQWYKEWNVLINSTK